MSDPLSTIVGAVLAAIGAAITTALAGVRWLLSRHIKRTDEHETRIAALEKDSVSSDDLDRTVTRIEAKVGEVHTRLDDIYKILIHKGS